MTDLAPDADESLTRQRVHKGYREHWARAENYRAGWEGRAKLAATLIDPRTSVLDIGCGRMALRDMLPEGCLYTPADLQAWTPEVVKVDLDAGEFPPGTCDCIVLLGVLEYLLAPEDVLLRAGDHAAVLVVSFCHPRENETVDMRRARRWINDYNELQIKAVFERAGWRISAVKLYGERPASGQNIYRLERAGPIGKQMTSAQCDVEASFERSRLQATATEVRARHLTFLSPAKLRSLLDVVDEVRSGGTPGDIAEFGIALGGSAICLASALGEERRFVGFDVFGMIPPPTEADGIGPNERYRTIQSGRAKGIGQGLYYGYIDDLYNVVKGNFESFDLPVDGDHIRLVKGPFEETLSANVPAVIALAHIDCDWYEPVKLCLETVYPRLSNGGFMILDDYLSWEGCRKATDAFCASHGNVEVVRLSPHAVLRKQARD